jgi:hypothetical protein
LEGSVVGVGLGAVAMVELSSPFILLYASGNRKIVKKVLGAPKLQPLKCVKTGEPL